MAKYGKKTQKEVRKQMEEYKQQNRWKNPQQAIAVGLSKARAKGYKVPKKEK